MQKTKVYFLTENDRLQLILGLDELAVPGKLIRPITNFLANLQPVELSNVENELPDSKNNLQSDVGESTHTNLDQ